MRSSISTGIYMLSYFFKKNKKKTNFPRKLVFTTTFLGKGASYDKSECTTFSIANDVPNIFSKSNIFENSQYIKKRNKKRHPFCRGASYAKNEYDLFYYKLCAEYFFITLFFQKKQFSLRERRITVFGDRDYF